VVPGAQQLTVAGGHRAVLAGTGAGTVAQWFRNTLLEA
jgi:hypothetical protein